MTALDDYYRWWSEVEIHAPMTLEACRLCGAVVCESTGMEAHRKYHEAKGEAPGSALRVSPPPDLADFAIPDLTDEERDAMMEALGGN